MRRAFAVVAAVSLVWACRSTTEEQPTPTVDASTVDASASADDGSVVADAARDGASADVASDVVAADSGSDAADAADAASADAGFPALGVYTVATDGGGLQLLIDAGTNELSHVRLGASDRLVATRYGRDPDGNGLAMENEVGFGAYYDGTEIVTFARTAPYAQTVVAGQSTGGVAANPSWTADQKVLYLANAADAGVTSTHLERATFGAYPAVSSRESIPVPAQLLVPVDPHQTGVSTSAGAIAFSAIFNDGSGWMRPLWKMPANGTSSLAAVTFVGCPICPLQGGCCKWSNVADVLGTNDSRFSNAGGDIVWMQQHPNVSVPVGSVTLYPYRQAMRPLDGGAQVDMTPPGAPTTTTYAYAEWRADDQELVYWAIEIENVVVRQHLYVMARDGSNRRRIPLPDDLCPLHASYLSASEIVFNAWRAPASDHSCDPAHL